MSQPELGKPLEYWWSHLYFCSSTTTIYLNCDQFWPLIDVVIFIRLGLPCVVDPFISITQRNLYTHIIFLAIFLNGRVVAFISVNLNKDVWLERKSFTKISHAKIQQALENTFLLVSENVIIFYIFRLWVPVQKTCDFT